MTPCTECRSQMLDHLYGLLEPAESAAVAGHLRGCPSCAAELERERGLLAAAAKSAFPEASFRPPQVVDLTAEPSRQDEPARRPNRNGWVRWVVAAGVLVAVCGAGLPALVSTVGYAQHRPKVDAEVAALDRIKDEQAALRGQIAARKKAAEDALDQAKAKHEELEKQWIAAEAEAVKRMAEKPFLVQLSGPAAAVAGAPNEYKVSVTDAHGKPISSPVKAEAKLKDATGTELFAAAFDVNPAAPHSIKVPSGVWSKVSAGADVFLNISATDKSGARSDLTENIRLMEPVYTTFLTTDKPMYRPGETVFFRSLTLDRTRFLPPEHDKTLRYEVVAPSGQVLAGSELVGLARVSKPDATGAPKPVLGPDGAPVRGVGGGAYTMPAEVAGGEYTLNLYEVPLPNEPVKVGSTGLLAARKFVVNNYTPDRYLKKLEFDGKSYGPGDVVQAKFDLKDQGKPLADTPIRVSAQADGQEVRIDAVPMKTDKDGFASIRFTLPKKDEIKSASVSVQVTTPGVVEALVRPVPLSTRKLTLEFFPEGGDLVAGVMNRVYFRATTSFGKPADVTGVLTDGTDTVAVKTLTDPDHPGANQGMGAFEFTPTAGKTYAVKLDKPIGLVQPDGGYKLPELKKQGVVLNIPSGVSKPNEPIQVRLTSVGEKRTVLVGAYIRGRSVAHQKVTLEPGKATAADLNPGDTKLGGVTRVTVFDLPNDDAIGREDLKPLAERLVYRAPGESLKLSYTARKSGGEKPAGAFVPGARVDLDIQSKDESGAAKAAVLWSAVVNQSVITMADEKTERQLPTHFLLSGEVKKGDELEYADFLLTDHPKAGPALDLMLGTQGWRRFAEQAPAEFRKKVPAEDADRILIASVESGPIPTGWRPALRRVFDDYWPKYESGLAAVERAEQAKAAAHGGGDADRELQRADGQYQQHLTALGLHGSELEGYDKAWQTLRWALPYTLAVLFGFAALAFAVRQVRFPAPSTERRLLGVMVVVMLVLMGSVALMALYTGTRDDKWVQAYQIAPKPIKEARAADAGMPPPANQRPAAPPPPAMMPMGLPKEAAPMDFARAGLDRAEGAMPKADRGFAPAPAAAAGLGGPGGAPAPAGPLGGAGGLPPGGGGGRGGFGGGFAGGGPAARGVPQMKNGFAGENKGLVLPAKPMAKKPVDGQDRFKLAPGEPADARAARLPFAEGERAMGLEMADGAKDKKRLTTERVTQLDGLLRRRNQELEKATRQNKADEKGWLAQFEREVRLTDFVPVGRALPVREYAHTRPELPDDAPRTDFTETLLWHPVIVTPSDGKATLTFSLSDEVAPYRVLVAGHTLDGRIGAITGTLEVRKPFSLDPKLPQEVSSSDVLDVPVTAVNATDAARTADVTVSTVGLKATGADQFKLDLTANGGGRKLVSLTPDKLEGDLSVQLSGKAGGDRDTVLRTLTVVPDGFPASGSKSDVLEQKVATSFQLPEQVVPGSMKLKVSVYPNTLSEVQGGLEAMLREPNGCFEQTSTTNYPNVLVLDYLNETDQAKPDVSKRAKELLDRGYGKLTSFECRKGTGREGYEWFGGTAPPHEALSAYGLLQFTDMARVHPVDAEMMKRTKEYLLNARDGKGGFKKNARALDTFGYAPAPVTNAYIVWAISESERKAEAKSDLDKEVDAVLALAKDGATANDPYYLGLAANAALNRGKRKAGDDILGRLAKLQQKGGEIPGAATSITNSRGEALLIETTSLAVLGWLKANETGTYRDNVDRACKWIGSKRSGYGGYGSTQSTILALKALIEFARGNKRPAENGTIRVYADDVEIAKKEFTTEQTGPIVVEVADGEKVFRNGAVNLRVETDAKQAYPCTVSWECRTRKPNSSAECPIELTTKLDKADVPEGETVRLAVRVKNTKEKQNGMVTAIVGLPAGLKVPEDLKQLKALTERPNDGKRPTVSYWEKRGRELVFYWHGLNEGEAVEFGVDLIAEVPGTYRGPASRAYLYYGAEHKHWIDPLAVRVTAK